MSPARPLANLRVPNFGWVWAGPVVGQTLGFLGAEVYKIGSRARIDLTRMLPPFGEGVRDPDRSLSNHACWAANGSVSLNLKKPEARDLALQLVAQCDVVVENFGPGFMTRAGLGYEDLCALKPDIVMFSMPAAGLYGPLKDVRTYGLSLTSITRLDSLTGYVGGGPIPVENAFSDPLNGIFGAFAILTALMHRDSTGKGQHIDYSQAEAVMQLVGPAYMDYALNGRVAGPKGNQHPLGQAAPHGVFPCRGDDRWISIAVFTDDEWDGLRAVMADPEWARRPDFASRGARCRNVAVGGAYGKIKAMKDQNSKNIKNAEPSFPVLIAGLSKTPFTGDILQVCPDEKTAREKADAADTIRTTEDRDSHGAMVDMVNKNRSGELKTLKVILKTDTKGSFEAIKQSLEKVKHDEVMINVIRSDVGNVKETDVMMASASGAMIIGFHVDIPAQVEKSGREKRCNY